MRQLSNQQLHASTLQAAAARARSAPDDRLPCPVCATSCKGRNLPRHVTEKHPEDHAHQQTGRLALVGIDRRIRRWFWTLAVLWLVLLGAVVALAPDELEDSRLRSTESLSSAEVRTALGDLATSTLGSTILGGLVLLVVLVAAVKLDAFRATVTVTPDEVRLRHRCGTGLVRVPLQAQLEVGRLYQRRSGGSDGDGMDHAYEVHQGAYLRLAHGRRSVTVGCPHDTDLRKHWTGVQPGRRRKVWDVDLTPGAFVALQYALGDAGQLIVRTPADS